MPYPIAKRLTTVLATLAVAGCTQAPVLEKPTAAVPLIDMNAVQQPAHGAVCGRPAYPEELRNVGATGTSVLSFRVGTDGTVLDAKVVKSSGYAGLDNAALSVLSSCRWKPAQQNGKPVETWVPLQYVWTLD